MTKIWFIRIILLIILQIFTSVSLISRGRKKLSYFTEILLSVVFIAYDYYGVKYIIEKYPDRKIAEIYADNLFKKEYLIIFCLGYIFMKIILLMLVYILKYFSFYAIVSITKNGLLAKICYKIFGKKKFVSFTSRMWNKADYGIAIKKGLPGMVNKVHKLTGVHFDKDGFPKFKSFYTVKLKRNLYRKTRETHFRYANKMLHERIKKDKRFYLKFTKSELKLIAEGNTPDRFTWHHHQDSGVLELVDRQIHAKVNHRGGYSIWGKKE